MIFDPIMSLINGLRTKVGNATLTTTAQDLSGGVNELNDQIGDLTPSSTDGAFTIVSTAIVNVNTQKTIRIGNILIIELLFRVNNNITDGDILFTLRDTSILFNATQTIVANIRSITAVPFMARTAIDTRNILAWSDFTPDPNINTWCSLEFIVEIKEA